MSAVFSRPNARIPAKIANSRADAPRSSVFNADAFSIAIPKTAMKILFRRIICRVLLIQQLTSARDRSGWYIEACHLASRRVRTLLIDIAGTVDEHGVGNHHKAIRPIA